MFKKLVFTSLFTFLLTFGLAVDAQFSGNIMGEQLSITLEPAYPAPGEQIKASVDDFSINSQGSAITWTLNGEVLTEMSNRRSFSFTADPDGETMTIGLTLTSQAGQTMRASRTITPAYLDIIVEPITYSPPFYRGRTLPIFGSRVLLTALVHNQSGPVDPSEYTYRWRFANEVVNEGPTLGGYKTLVTVPHGRNITTAVEVTDSNNRTIARRIIQIPSANIDVEFYEISPLYGLSTRALQNNHPIVSNNTTIYAIPYNLDMYSTQNLNTEWELNNRPADTSSNDPFEFSILRDGVGSSEITFKIRNTIQLLQGDEHSVRVTF